MKIWPAKACRAVRWCSESHHHLTFCLEFACSTHVCGFSPVFVFLPQTKVIQLRLIGDCKLFIYECEWLFLLLIMVDCLYHIYHYMSALQYGGGPSRACPASCLMSAEELQPLCYPQKNKHVANHSHTSPSIGCRE